MTRLGEMAAVVAHEVKNPVAGISGVLQVLGSRMPPDGSDRAILGDIQDRIDSLNAIVQDLLLFSRPTAQALASANIRSLLTNTIAMLRCDPSLVDVDVQITGDDPTMRVDSTQLKIVFLHLLLNTAQAMGGRGRSRWPCGRLPIGRGRDRGPRARTQPRGVREDVRAVLHDETSRQRPWLADRQTHHRGSRRRVDGDAAVQAAER